MTPPVDHSVPGLEIDMSVEERQPKLAMHTMFEKHFTDLPQDRLPRDLVRGGDDPDAIVVGRRISRAGSARAMDHHPGGFFEG